VGLRVGSIPSPSSLQYKFRLKHMASWKHLLLDLQGQSIKIRSVLNLQALEVIPLALMNCDGFHL
jgi:hypothetical protein